MLRSMEILAANPSLLHESFLRRKEDITGEISAHMLQLPDESYRRLGEPRGTPMTCCMTSYLVPDRHQPAVMTSA